MTTMKPASASTAPAPAASASEAAEAPAAPQMAGGIDDGIELDGTSTLPEDNASYKRREYWDARFAKEEAYEWLVGYGDVQGLLAPYLPPAEAEAAPGGARVLVIGCGNSDFSKELLEDLRAAGRAAPATVVSLDYSAVVIEKMRAKHQGEPGLEWVVHDMRALPECFEAESFDLVVDKAGTDALCTDEGDPWNPHASVIQDLDSICEGVLRVLKPGGRFVSISFQQPHFRRKYLLGTHAGKEYPWELVVQDIESTKSLPHFFYAATKR